MDELRTYIYERGISQSQLASEFGILQPHLSHLLAGNRTPSLKLAIKIEQVTEGAVPVSSWRHHETRG